MNTPQRVSVGRTYTGTVVHTVRQALATSMMSTQSRVGRFRPAKSLRVPRVRANADGGETLTFLTNRGRVSDGAAVDPVTTTR